MVTSPADTGAVTISFPQDVQAEAWDFPTALFRERTWHVPRARADRAALRRAAQVIGAAKRPVIIAGGGVIYSAATAELADFVAKTGIPVGVTQAGKASLPYDHPQMVNALGASRSVFANALANEADVIIGIGTRYTDFTTASNTLFTNPDVQFVNINVTELDAYKESGLALIGDAREIITELAELAHRLHRRRVIVLRCEAAEWRTRSTGSSRYRTPPLSQAEAIGIVNAAAGDHHVVVNAAGSMPGDLHRLWRPPTPRPTTSSTATPAWATRWAVHRRQDGRPHPRRLLLHRRRHVPALQPGDHDRGPGGPEAHRVAGRQLRLRLHRRPVGDPWLPGLRLPVQLPRRRRPVLRRPDQHRPRRQRRQLRRRRPDRHARPKSSRRRSPTRRHRQHRRDLRRGRHQGPLRRLGAWWDVPVSEVSEVDSTQQARKEYEAEVANQRLYL